MMGNMTVDNALKVYTDKLNAKKKINIRWFEKRMNSTDFTEFEGLYPFIALLKLSYAAKNKKFARIGFDEMMKQLDEEMKRLYWYNHGKVGDE